MYPVRVLYLGPNFDFLSPCPQFKACHEGKKPATGRQKDALRSKGIDFDNDLTKEDATSMLETATQTSDEPITDTQARWLAKRNVSPNSFPTTGFCKTLTLLHLSVTCTLSTAVCGVSVPQLIGLRVHYICPADSGG
jgi:hypothetical protein